LGWECHVGCSLGLLSAALCREGLELEDWTASLTEETTWAGFEASVIGPW